jgi:ABC-type sugar transport system ATPase subunit
MAHLELAHVSKSFGSTRVVDDVSLDVGDGEFLVLVGPSGCGKSTLLRIVAGLESATSGELRLDSQRVDDLGPRERDVAMVFQNYALYPHMSVRGNLEFPLKIARVARPEIERRLRATAEMLGLAELLERKPSTLSGGQMQRVALGRALIREPRVFLFDEPLSNLDAQLRQTMRAEIAELHRRLKITTLYVTHDQAEALTMGSRIAVLERGRVLQVGAPLEVFARPATTFVATFIGSPAMNLLRVNAHDGRVRLGALELACPARVAGEVVLGIRPHEIELCAPGAGCDAQVSAVEQLGTQTTMACSVDGARVVVSREGSHTVAVGERVGLRLPQAALHWFSAGNGARIEGDRS